MLVKKIALVSALVMLVSGCEQMDQLKDKLMGAKPELADEKIEPVDAVATVNGQPVSVNVFNSYVRARMQHQQGIDIEKHRGAIINELVNRQLLVQEAIKNGLDKKPQVNAEIEGQRDNILSSVMIRQQLTQNPVTEEMVKQEYDDFIKSTNFDEYNVSYIMVATKEEADTVIASLDKGANFAETAKQKSLDPNGKQGGSLGWVTPNKLPPPFAQMLASIEKGKHGSMSGPNGWHIFRMDDIRTAAAPSFEESKQGMEGRIQKKRLEEYINSLRATANIEIKAVEKAPAPAPAENTPVEATQAEPAPAEAPTN